MALPAGQAQARAVLSRYLSEEVIDQVLAYEPASLSTEQWQAIRSFCLDLLPILVPPTVDAFRKQVQPLLKFLTWTHQCGYPLEVDSVFTAERVETWRDVAFADANSRRPSMTKATVAAYVARVRQMGPRLNPAGGWPPPAGDVEGGVKRHLRAPYTDVQLAELTAAIATMPPGAARDAATSLMAIGLGFGPAPGEYQLLRTSHIRTLDDGPWVQIPGQRPRLVPVAEPWGQELIRMRSIEPDAALLPLRQGKNALGQAARALRLGAKATVLSPQRLRTTWMIDRLRTGVDPRLLMEWAGLSTLNNLPDLLSYLPEPDSSANLAMMRVNPRAPR